MNNMKKIVHIEFECLECESMFTAVCTTSLLADEVGKSVQHLGLKLLSAKRSVATNATDEDLVSFGLSCVVELDKNDKEWRKTFKAVADEMEDLFASNGIVWGECDLDVVLKNDKGAVLMTYRHTIDGGEVMKRKKRVKRVQGDGE